ncbi:MAG: flavin reductase family protein [Thermoanaerobaculia bacterium]|nr:flavin reductase family protein [Thermoanaerobaculia bacterium]
MPIGPDQFKDALRHFASGVTILTIRAGEVRHGLTVSAFASVSPEPPLVAVLVDQRHRGHRLLEEAGAAFAVNVLDESQAELADRFAWSREADRFAAGRWTEAVTGAPILEDALAWLDCRLVDRHAAGSHTIFVGEVLASAAGAGERGPLLYWNRAYRRIGG